MHVILNQCIRGKMAQTMFAVFLHSTLRILIYIIGISITAASFSAKGGASFFSVLFALLLLILANFAGELLSYGLYSVLAPLVRNKASSIRNIFSGFYDRKRKVIKAAWIFTAINTASILGMGILSALLAGPAETGNSDLKLGQSTLIAAIAFIVLVILLTLPFTFSYLILLTKEGVGVKESFSVSWKLLRRQVLHFTGFVIYAGGADLAAAIILQLVLLVIPSGEGAGSSLQLFATLASFMGLLAQYRAMSRSYLAICIYFFSEAGILHPHGGKENELAIGSEAAPKDTEQAENTVPEGEENEVGGPEA